MYNRSRPEKIVYKRWRNPDLRREENFVQQSNEDKGTDPDICSITSKRVDTGEGNSASISTDDKTIEDLTVDDVLDVIGFGKFQWKLSLLTGLSWTADAMEMMLLSILGPQLRCEWRLPSYKKALMTSVVFLGTGISSPLWGNFFDKNGRRMGLRFAMCLTAYFGLLSAFAPSYGWLLVLRVFVGFGIGGTTQAVTLYSEFLPTKMRGTCVMAISIFWAIGAVFEVLLALLVMPTLGWRWLLGLSTSPVVIVLLFFSWLPESPRFDMLSGNTEKAMATLKRIAKENGKAFPQGMMITPKQRDRGRMKGVFSPPYCKTAYLLCFIWFVNAFSYYGIVLLTTELLQTADTCDHANGGANNALNCNLECKFLTSADYRDLLWTTLAEIPGVLFVLLLVDRIGRRRSIALGFFMFSLFVLPLYACIGRTALTIFIFIARAFITGGYQAVFVYTPEAFPTENRALALGTCSAMARLGSLVTPFVSQVMLKHSMYLALSIYCGCCLLAGFASLILPIETLGRGLQESNQDQESGVQSPTTISQPRRGEST